MPGPVALWSHYLAYAPDRDRVVVCDLNLGRVTTVDPDGGSADVVDYAVGTDDMVVYGTLSSAPEVGSAKPVEWVLRAFDLESGDHQELARVSAVHDDVPRPSVAGNWAAWTEASAGGSAINVVDLRSHRRRTVVSAERQPGGVGVTPNGLVVFDGSSGDGRRDVFVVTADGSSEPRKVTDQGDVRSLAVANGRAAWRTGPPTESGARWTMVPGVDETPVRVDTRARVVPGTDFLVAEEPLQGGFPRLAVHDVARPSTSWPLVAEDERVDLGSYWDVSGDLIAWVALEYPPTNPLKRHLRLARVVRGP